MSLYSFYDAKENVIFTDLTGIIATPQTVDAVVDEAIEIARQLPNKVFMVVCWKDVKLDQASAERHGQRQPELLKYVCGLIRYDVTDTISRINLRAEAVKYNLQKAQAHIYSSKEEAMAVVRRLEESLKLIQQ